MGKKGRGERPKGSPPPFSRRTKKWTGKKGRGEKAEGSPLPFLAAATTLRVATSITVFHLALMYPAIVAVLANTSIDVTCSIPNKHLLAVGQSNGTGSASPPNPSSAFLCRHQAPTSSPSLLRTAGPWPLPRSIFVIHAVEPTKGQKEPKILPGSILKAQSPYPTVITDRYTAVPTSPSPPLPHRHRWAIPNIAGQRGLLSAI